MPHKYCQIYHLSCKLTACLVPILYRTCCSRAQFGFTLTNQDDLLISRQVHVRSHSFSWSCKLVLKFCFTKNIRFSVITTCPLSNFKEALYIKSLSYLICLLSRVIIWFDFQFYLFYILAVHHYQKLESQSAHDCAIHR